MNFTAEQEFMIAALAPQKPQKKEDLIFLIREGIPHLENEQLQSLAESCISTLIKISEEEYAEFSFTPARD